MHVRKAAENTLAVWKANWNPATWPESIQDPRGLSICHLIWMLDQIIEHSHNDWPRDKLNRWLGYVQGILVIRGIMTLEEAKRCNKEA